MKWIKPSLGIQLRKGHPLSKGLVGVWLMNEGSGKTVFDLSGNNQTGTLQADANFDVGKFGSLIDFDGTGDFILVATNNDIGNGPYTVIARVQTGADVTSQTRLILGKRNTANTYPFIFGLDSYIAGKTQMGLVRWDGTTAKKALSGTDAIANKDYWVAGTWDGTDLKLYVDGILKGTTDASALGDSSNADDYTIGSRERSGSELYWDGKIYYVYLYNRGLSTSEIAQLHKEPFAMFQKTDWALWNAAISVGAPTATTRLIKIGGTFVAKPIKEKKAGTFEDKPISIKVGGTFQDA